MEKKMKQYPQINQYLDCKEEVRELERLLYEARERYRKKARNINKQSWGDWTREWVEWVTGYDETIEKKLRDVREEKNKYDTDMIFHRNKEDNDGLFESYFNYATSNRDTTEECYNNYNKYLNSDDIDSDTI
jgi:hypothetical protein